MSTSSLQNRSSKTCIGTSICKKAKTHCSKFSIFIAAGCHFYFHRMTFYMVFQTFFPGKLHLNRNLCKVGQKSCVMLYRHIFFTAKAAANIGTYYSELFTRDSKKTGDFTVVIINRLSAGIHCKPSPFRIWYSKGCFWFQKGMLLKRSLVGICNNKV